MLEHVANDQNDLYTLDRKHEQRKSQDYIYIGHKNLYTFLVHDA